MTFKKVLLNTCQEEFEGTHEAREARALLLLHSKSLSTSVVAF